jgi:hypothetical protein
MAEVPLMAFGRIGIVLTLGAALCADPAAAQSRSAGRPRPSVEVTGGWAGFLDESPVDHAVIGGAARVSVSPRVSVGPEIVWMRGPRTDRDLFFTGNLTFDLAAAGSPAARSRLIPFVVVGGGVFRHSDRFVTGTFASYEGAVTGGGGLRVRLNDRLHAAIDVRTGWEPHVRVGGVMGLALGR